MALKALGKRRGTSRTGVSDRTRLVVAAVALAAAVCLLAVPIPVSGAVLTDNTNVLVYNEAETDAFITQLNFGNGILTTTTDPSEVYEGEAALKLTNDQRFDSAGVFSVLIRENPGVGEYRYFTFAWRKVVPTGEGGIQIQLQKAGVPGPEAWNQRYHAGTPIFDNSIALSATLPLQYQVYTVDLWSDFGGDMELIGIGLALQNSGTGHVGLFDKLIFHRFDVEPTFVGSGEVNALLFTATTVDDFVASLDGTTDGTGSTETCGSYVRAAHLVATDGEVQTATGLGYVITANPTGTNQFRYATFAWRKDAPKAVGVPEGGIGIQFKSTSPSFPWEQRYHAGDVFDIYGGVFNSIQLSASTPGDWEIHTVDLFADWGGFTIDAINLTPSSVADPTGHVGSFDNFALHQKPLPPTLGGSVNSQDCVPPTVVASPADGAVDVAATLTTITLTFSEAINLATVGTGACNSPYIALCAPDGVTDVVSSPPTWDANRKVGVFTVDPTPLQYSGVYTIAISDQVLDSTGTSAVPQVLSFTVEDEPTMMMQDTERPYVISSEPVNGADNVPITMTHVEIVFSEPIDAGSIDLTTEREFILSHPGAWDVPGTFTITDSTLYFEPVACLEPDTIYTVTLTDYVSDLNGQFLYYTTLQFRTRRGHTDWYFVPVSRRDSSNGQAAMAELHLYDEFGSKLTPSFRPQPELQDNDLDTSGSVSVTAPNYYFSFDENVLPYYFEIITSLGDVGADPISFFWGAGNCRNFGESFAAAVSFDRRFNFDSVPGPEGVPFERQSSTGLVAFVEPSVVSFSPDDIAYDDFPLVIQVTFDRSVTIQDQSRITVTGGNVIVLPTVVGGVVSLTINQIELGLIHVFVDDDFVRDGSDNGNRHISNYFCYGECCHPSDGIRGTFEVTNGYCACESGYAVGDDPSLCEDKAPSYCFALPQEIDFELDDISRVEEGRLVLGLLIDIAAGRRIVSITVGEGSPECDYPGPAWFKTYDVGLCQDALYSNISWSILSDPAPIGCGLSAPRLETELPAALRSASTSSPHRFWVQDVDMVVEVEDTIKGFVLGPVDEYAYVVRTTSTLFRASVAFPAMIEVTVDDFESSSRIDLEAGFVSQRWDMDNGQAVFELQTSIRWPYQIDDDTFEFLTTPNAAAIEAKVVSLVSTDCPADVQGESCVQVWSVLVTPTEICELDGNYTLHVDLLCRDDLACVAMDSTVLTLVNVRSTDICDIVFVENGNTLSATLAAYVDDDYLVESNEFFVGEDAYFELAVTSPHWIIDDVVPQFAIATRTDGGDSTPIPTPLTTLPSVGGATESRFKLYITSSTFSQDGPPYTETYRLEVVVVVRYSDGSRRRGSVPVGARDTDETTFSVKLDITVTDDDTDGGDNGNDGLAADSNEGAASSALIGAATAILGASLVIFVGALVFSRQRLVRDSAAAACGPCGGGSGNNKPADEDVELLGLSAAAYDSDGSGAGSFRSLRRASVASALSALSDAARRGAALPAAGGPARGREARQWATGKREGRSGSSSSAATSISSVSLSS